MGWIKRLANRNESHQSIAYLSEPLSILYDKSIGSDFVEQIPRFLDFSMSIFWDMLQKKAIDRLVQKLQRRNHLRVFAVHAGCPWDWNQESCQDRHQASTSLCLIGVVN